MQVRRFIIDMLKAIAIPIGVGILIGMALYYGTYIMVFGI